MEFVTLNQAIALMVLLGGDVPELKFLVQEDREYQPGSRSSEAEYRSICRRSYMAGRLHQLITNCADDAAIRWLRQHEETGQPVIERDPSFAREALDRLARMGAYVHDEFNAAYWAGPGGPTRVGQSRVVSYPDRRVQPFLPMVERHAIAQSDLTRLLQIAGFALPWDIDGRQKAANDETTGNSGIPLPTAAASTGRRSESAEQRQARRHRMCVEYCAESGLKMPTDDYARLPRGINMLAEKEGITRQAFAEDVKAHIRRINGK